MIRYSRVEPEIAERCSSRVSRGKPRPAETITHGRQITRYNTGYTAWYDSTLRRNLAFGDLNQVDGVHLMSDFYASGTSGSPTLIYAQHFTDTARVDLDWVTFRGCLFDQPTTTAISGTHHFGVVYDYCTVFPPEVPGHDNIDEQSFSTIRCYLRGCAHSLRTDGGATDQRITETYSRIKMQDPCDHNDNVQNFGGSGNVYIERCNFDLEPEGGLLTGCLTGVGGPNACVISADLSSSSVLHLEVNDCLLRGTGEHTLQFSDGALTSNIVYGATGNRFIRNSSTPLYRGVTNTTPTGQIAWSGNVYHDNDESIPLA